jgi:hypothetical protein
MHIHAASRRFLPDPGIIFHFGRSVVNLPPKPKKMQDPLKLAVAASLAPRPIAPKREMASHQIRQNKDEIA